MRIRDITELQDLIGYQFKDISLLDAAFTHSSVNNGVGKNYERLEFLGDALMNLVITDYVYTNYPDYPEGKLTQMKASVINGETMAQLSRRRGFDEFISINKGLRKQGIPDSIFCDVVEGLAAAVFLDAGILYAREFVLQLFELELEKAASSTKDSKSRLQENVQKRSNEIPVYEIVDIAGEDHCRNFSATVTICGIVFGPCDGPSKKKAEQSAALLALKAFVD